MLDRYVTRSMHSVTGYLTVLDARIMAALLSYQHASSVTGHLCEIGVHHGRSFFLLALARRAGERSVAIDLFEDDEMTVNTSHAGRDRGLFSNAERLKIALSSEEIFKTSSLEITAADIQARTTGGVRFFSLDGCHLSEFVANDLRLAAATLTADGVIAVDDFFNTSWPDVTAVTCEYLRQATSIVPFALSTSKLYLAPPDVAERYKTALTRHAGLPQMPAVRFLGHEVLTARHGAVQRGLNAVRGMVASRLARS